MAEKTFVNSDNWFNNLVEYVGNNVSSSSQQQELNSSIPQFSEVSNLKWRTLYSTDIVDILPDSNKLNLSSERVGVNLEKIIAAFLHPDVIDLVFSKITE